MILEQLEQTMPRTKYCLKAGFLARVAPARMAGGAQRNAILISYDIIETPPKSASPSILSIVLSAINRRR